MDVRASGACNMLDLAAVGRYAFDHEMFDLVVYLEENKKDYVNFILYGEVDAGDGIPE
jgi:hypothetical protein